jgi:excisionase family DNA binding protein
MLGMSLRWVHERVRRREIPYYRFGRALRFDPEEIRRWRTQYRNMPEAMRRERR